ncbi:hypothetical protein [Chloroflexus aggregans]|uniref:Uncharacterized protein n=1 Tax=Chloroflexus aggregans (strain MD-66 / DSM 9485) TaxID=326427 RepID=B8GAF3_CHLAD|nr:hypothetical protein [Chloroflexus aggregans]ACL26528.1 hypothetical protein Cagg_3692 [Chloroflexus aggregans DSM 9485]
MLWPLSPDRCFSSDPARRTLARALYEQVKTLPQHGRRRRGRAQRGRSADRLGRVHRCAGAEQGRPCPPAPEQATVRVTYTLRWDAAVGRWLIVKSE